MDASACCLLEQAAFAVSVGLAQAFDGASPRLSLRRPESVAFATSSASTLFSGTVVGFFVAHARSILRPARTLNYGTA